MPSVGMVGSNAREMARDFMFLSKGAANCYPITKEQSFGAKINVLVADSSDLLLLNLIQS